METKEIIFSLNSCGSLMGCNSECKYHKRYEPSYCRSKLLKDAADRLKELESKEENLIDYNADLNNRLNKAESHIEKLEKQLSEKQLEPEWISVEDGKEMPDAFSYTGIRHNQFPRLVVVIDENSHVTHWMMLDAPKPKEPTFKDKFLEMFPKAELNNFQVPVVCAGALFLYLRDSCKNSDCYYNSREYQEKCCVCWNQPYFEPEEEGEADA